MINNDLKKRRTSNQQSTSTAARERNKGGNRVSSCGDITINKKISFNGGVSKSGGNVVVARIPARTARAGAMRRGQRDIAASAAARTGVAWQQ